tara:strand:+ start:947 stop:1315 length:369 start_codon:yes stop_codon:yes gene_type:complete
MKREYLTTEQFEQKIRNEFDNLSDNDFKRLIQIALPMAAGDNDFIYAIAQTCSKTNNLTFRQYKALSAFVNTEKKKLNTKTFNKVSSVISKPIIQQPTINNWDGGGWKPNGKYQQPINRKKF